MRKVPSLLHSCTTFFITHTYLLPIRISLIMCLMESDRPPVVPKGNRCVRLYCVCVCVPAHVWEGCWNRGFFVPAKREAWALHLLLCALPKRAEVKSQGDWRIPRCMPTDQVSRGGGGSRMAPGGDRCLCMCAQLHIYPCELGPHMHRYVFMCELVQAAPSSSPVFFFCFFLQHPAAALALRAFGTLS